MGNNNKQECLTFTVEETAVLLGISRSAAYQAANKGLIPSLRIGRRIVIPKKKIDEMMNKSQSLLWSNIAENHGGLSTEQSGNNVIWENGKKLLYLMQLEPLKYPELIKVGYTAGIRYRFYSIHSLYPRVKLIKTWLARQNWEAQLISSLKQDEGCNYLSGELFECNNLIYLTAKIDYFIKSKQG